MKAFSEWYFAAVSSGLEQGLVLLGILSCVSCPDKSDFTFNLRVSPGLGSSSPAPLRSQPTLIQPSPTQPYLPLQSRRWTLLMATILLSHPLLVISSTHLSFYPYTANFIPLCLLFSNIPKLHAGCSSPFLLRTTLCLSAAGWYLSSPVSHWSHLAVRSAGDEVNY